MSQQDKAAVAVGREGERRRTILRAAIDVFARKGFHGCRIADVAREAGVAYGLVYHYFKNKDELLAQVFETAWGGFVARMRQVAESEGALADKVRGIADVAFEAYRVDPRGVRVLILEIARSPSSLRVHRDTAFAEVIRMSAVMFERARESGEVRADLDPRLAAALLFGAIEMGLTAFVMGLVDAGQDVALEHAKVQLAETFLKGVLPPGGQGPARGEGEWKPERSATRPKAVRRS